MNECPRATSRWLLLVPAGPTRHRFSFTRTHSRLERFSKAVCFIEEARTSNSSGVLVTRKGGSLEPVGRVGSFPRGDLGLDEGAQELLVIRTGFSEVVGAENRTI
jgi:hypothetical protein